jgi:hypothetical protein
MSFSCLSVCLSMLPNGPNWTLAASPNNESAMHTSGFLSFSLASIFLVVLVVPSHPMDVTKQQSNSILSLLLRRLTVLLTLLALFHCMKGGLRHGTACYGVFSQITDTTFYTEAPTRRVQV